MRIELTPGLILHRSAWRDTSLLVEALTRDHGRVGLIAKGARRPKARWRGLLEPLMVLDLSWSGRGELYTLTGADLRQRHVLSGHALMAGLYANELIMRLTARDDPHPGLYDSLLALLGPLETGAPAIVALRFFERNLLDELGYGLPLEATSDTGEPIHAGRRYLYHPAAGLRAADGRRDEASVAIGGRALQSLASGRFAHAEDVREARRVMQAALAVHLGGRPLKSVQTLHAMQLFRRSRRTHAGQALTQPAGDHS